MTLAIATCDSGVSNESHRGQARGLTERLQCTWRRSVAASLDRLSGLPFVEQVRSEAERSHYIEFLASLQERYPDFVARENTAKPW
ncbi:MAG: hypothetical protein ACI89D_001973 [Bermanella sp.]